MYISTYIHIKIVTNVVLGLKVFIFSPQAGDVLRDVLLDVLRNVLRDILCDVLHDVLRDILLDILRNVLHEVLRDIKNLTITAGR